MEKEEIYNKLMNGEIDSKSISVKDLKIAFGEPDYSEIDSILRCIEFDDRKSVVALKKSLINRLEKHNKEIERLKSMNFFENKYYDEGYLCIGGVDEAGRGPLAGPVVASIVVLGKNSMIEEINDSKKLSKVKREELFDIIKEEAIDYGIGIADNKEIDELNILNATYLAMKRAMEELSVKPDCILNDAVTIPGIDPDVLQVPIIKGDSKSASIAAASILAKVTRDRMMEEYDKEYPGYGFSKNMGYGTREHYEGLEKNGRTIIHRNSFLKGFEK